MHSTDPITLLDSLCAFSSEVWGRTFNIERERIEPSTLLTSTTLDEMLDTSLLRWPYLSVLREGAVPAMSAYTKNRDVIGHSRDGFIDGTAVRALMAQGATVKLNKLSDWHLPSREIVLALQHKIPVAVSSYAFWTPKQGQGMLPHRDGSHVFVIQLEGTKRWQLFVSDPEDIRANPGLDVRSTAPSAEFDMAPGDVLYLPHGWPHVTRTISKEPSLHLTFTLAEPTPEALLEAFAMCISRQGGDLSDRFHALPLSDRVVATQQFLLDCLDSFTTDELVDLSLIAMRKNEG